MECPQKADGMDDMLLFGVQIQSWVYQRNSPADAVIPIFAPDSVQRPVDAGPALGFLLLREPRQLHNAVRRRRPERQFCSRSLAPTLSDRPGLGLPGQNRLYLAGLWNTFQVEERFVILTAAPNDTIIANISRWNRP